MNNILGVISIISLKIFKQTIFQLDKTNTKLIIYQYIYTLRSELHYKNFKILYTFTVVFTVQEEMNVHDFMN